MACALAEGAALAAGAAERLGATSGALGRTPGLAGSALAEATATGAEAVGADAFRSSAALAEAAALATAGAAPVFAAGSGEALAAGAAGESLLLHAAVRAATNEATRSEEGARVRPADVGRREKRIGDMFPRRTTNGKRGERTAPHIRVRRSGQPPHPWHKFAHLVRPRIAGFFGKFGSAQASLRPVSP